MSNAFAVAATHVSSGERFYISAEFPLNGGIMLHLHREPVEMAARSAYWLAEKVKKDDSLARVAVLAV